MDGQLVQFGPGGPYVVNPWHEALAPVAADFLRTAAPYARDGLGRFSNAVWDHGQRTGRRIRDYLRSGGDAPGSSKSDRPRYIYSPGFYGNKARRTLSYHSPYMAYRTKSRLYRGYRRARPVRPYSRPRRSSYRSRYSRRSISGYGRRSVRY